MTRLRTLCLGLFALLCLSSLARADVPSPDGKYHPRPWRPLPGPPLPDPDSLVPVPPIDATPPDPTLPPIPKPSPQPQGPADVSIWRPTPRPAEPPQRTGPFRSCGSGMGVGFAGIGIAWALMWLGNRFAGRIARK